MSSDQSNQTSPNPAGGGRRRSSFVDLFGPRAQNPGQTGTPAQPRRLSISTLGLSTLPGAQSSPFNNPRGRTESVSSANSGSVDESPFEDEPGALPTTSVPTSPFARRMSFGAKAMRDIRSGGGANGNGPVNEGFDFAENLRARAERSSISTGSGMQGSLPRVHQRAQSITAMETPKPELPRERRVPDAFQERILKGDFYMD